MKITAKLKPEIIKKLRIYLGKSKPKTDKIEFNSDEINLLIKKGINGYIIQVKTSNMEVFDSITGYNRIEIEIDTQNNEITIEAYTYPVIKPIEIRIWLSEYTYVGYNIEVE